MEYTILILILPFLSFLILGLAGMRMKNSVAGAIGTASLTGVALLSYLTAFHYFTGGRTAAGTFPTLMPYNFEWLPFTADLHINMGILLDPISIMMLVVISTVSLMVHIYSFGYYWSASEVKDNGLQTATVWFRKIGAHYTTVYRGAVTLQRLMRVRCCRDAGK